MAISTKNRITKLEIILGGGNGHPKQFCGTGVHRNWKKQPKGGRKAVLRRALADHP